MGTPTITDPLNPLFNVQAWVQSNKTNYDETGNPIGDIPEDSTLHQQKLTAEVLNGLCAAQRSMSTWSQGVDAGAALSDGAALSVLGNATNATAARTDIAFGTSGHVLRRSGTTVGAGTLIAGSFATAPGIVTPAMLDNGTARSVLGVAGGSAARADIAATTDDTFLGRTGGSVSFSSISVNQVGDQILYDQDFSLLANNTFADGAEVIGSHTWTAANSAAGQIFDIQNGTGLRFDAAASSTVYTTTTRSAANISIPILTLIPTFDPIRSYMIDAYYTTLTLGSVANRVLICLDNNGAGTDHLSGGGPISTFIGTQIEATTSGATPYGAHNCIGTLISPHGVAGYAGTYSSGFPTAYALAGSYQPHATQNFTPAMDPTGARFVIAFVTGEAGGLMVATLRHVRARRVH